MTTVPDPKYKLRTIRAVWNMHSDKLQLFLDPNYSASPDEKEQFRALRRQLGKGYAPGHKLIEGRWSPAFEDLCLAQGHEIEFVCEPDDSKARAERFEKYAENADKDALNARSRWSHANTARRERMAGNRSLNESEKAAYWWDRVAGVVSHANYVEKVDSIRTKLAVLEKDINGQERWLPEYVGSLEDRGARQAKYSKYTLDEKYALQRYGADSDELLNEVKHTHQSVTYHRRYAQHLRQWQEYLMMYLEEAGGTVPEKEPRQKPIRRLPIEGNSLLEKGGAVKDYFFQVAPPCDRWCKILRINPLTVSIQAPGYVEKMSKRRIKTERIMSKASYEAFLQDGIERPGT